MPDMFFSGQPGTEGIRILNEMYAMYLDAVANASGYSPKLAVVSDGARRVHYLYDWEGTGGNKPTLTGYLGATGIVSNIANAVDIRGPQGLSGPANSLSIGTVTSAASPSATITGASPSQTLNLVLPKGDKGDTGNTGPANTLTIGTVTTGAASATITGTAPAQVLNLVVPQGIQGIQGIPGNTGWSPIFATVADGARFVLQVTDWAGGAGAKPAVGKYVGATGFVDAIASGVNIRGPAGTGSVSPSGTIAANDLAAFVDSLGTSIKAIKPADLPVSTATQNALNARAPLNGTGTSGTWPISVTGNSASLLSTDSRSVKPNAIGSGSARTFFASKTGMEGGAVTTDWVDLFAVNTYTDGTGGLTNALAFSKAGAGLWHYQGVFNSAAWNAPKQIAYTDSSITGNAATATKLATARTINGVSFDGTANITVADSTKLPLAGGTMTGLITFAGTQTWPTFNQSTTGNAATATKLATARTINGVSFDGSANISVSVDWSSVTGKPAVIAAGADKALARAAIDAMSVDEGITPFVLVTTTTQPAVAGVQYGLSNAAVTTLTLPASPSIETLVWVVVLNNRSDNVLARNGGLIGGLAEDMTIDNPKRPFAAKFIGGAIGWVIL